MTRRLGVDGNLTMIARKRPGGGKRSLKFKFFYLEGSSWKGNPRLLLLENSKAGHRNLSSNF